MQDNEHAEPAENAEPAEDSEHAEDAQALGSQDAHEPQETPAAEVSAPDAVTAASEEPVEAPEEIAPEAPAADLPTMQDLDRVAEEVQRVEATLPLLDKKNSPMCADCQSAFAEANASQRMDLLACTHS